MLNQGKYLHRLGSGRNFASVNDTGRPDKPQKLKKPELHRVHWQKQLSKTVWAVNLINTYIHLNAFKEVGCKGWLSDYQGSPAAAWCGS